MQMAQRESAYRVQATYIHW